MRTNAKQFLQSKFVRNVMIVATGTASAQAITMLFTPIITRLYGPEAFGVLGTFIAILGIITPLAALSYPIAIVLPKKDEDAIGLARISLGIALITSLCTALFIILFKNFIIRIFSLQSVELFILLLPLAMLFSACMAVVSQWAIRKKLFKSKAKIAVLQSLVLNIVKSFFGVVNPIATILVIITVFAELLHAVMLWLGVKAQKNKVTTSDKNEFRIKDLIIKYSDFAFYRTPQILVYSLGQALPVLMLVNFFGPATAGFYALSRSVLDAPTVLIGQSVADVFYPKFVEAVNAGFNRKKILIKACISLAAIGVIPYFIIAVFGPLLFSIVFGAGWKVAGEFARWMSIWLFVVLVSRPIISAIPVLSLQRQFLLFEFFALFVRVLSIFIGYLLFKSAIGAVILFTLSNVIVYIVLVFYVVYKA